MGRKKSRETRDCNIKHLFTDESGKVVYRTYQLAHITHFIVVPADGSDQLLVAHGHYFSLGGIEERSVMCTNHIAAHNFVFSISETFVASCFHCCIDFFSSYLFVEYGSELG